MRTVVERSPSRVDLAGGTLDLWPLYAVTGGASTINLAISIWTEVKIQDEKDQGGAIQGLELHSEDLKREWTFEKSQDLAHSSDPQLGLFREVLLKFPDLSNCRITTRSQSPVGGGIGGSSSLTISFLKALHSWLGRPLPETLSLVHWAHNLEARMLMTPTGTQDYFPAVSGGLNILDYSDETIVQKVLPVAGTPFETHTLVVNTARSHNSGLNNFDVLSRVVHKDQTVLRALGELKDVAAGVRELCLQKNWSALPDLFRRETAARLQLTPLFSSPEIERLKALVEREGGAAIKICGAGGGGCVLIWVEPSQKERVRLACEKEGFQILKANPVSPFENRKP